MFRTELLSSVPTAGATLAGVVLGAGNGRMFARGVHYRGLCGEALGQADSWYLSAWEGYTVIETIEVSACDGTRSAIPRRRGVDGVITLGAAYGVQHPRGGVVWILPTFISWPL